MLDENLREDLRAIGTTIGTIFYRDVTLISKQFNISSVNTFREALNVAMFAYISLVQAKMLRRLFQLSKNVLIIF